MEPPPRTCPARTRTDWEKDFKLREHTTAEWEVQRSEFKKLYLQENLKLPEIRKIMAQTRGFYANKRQFDRKIKEWGLNKNLKRKDAIIMLKKQNERLAAEGKQTEFTFNGLPVAMEKLQRHAAGYQPGDSPAVATPDYVQYCTPRDPGPGMPMASESYGTPRVDYDSTPIERGPGTPRPCPTPDQPGRSLNHDFSIDSEDTEMIDAESVPPRPDLFFPVNPIIESQDKESHTTVSSPPRTQHIDSDMIYDTTMSTLGSYLNTSLKLDKTGTERSPRNTHNSAGKDSVQRLCQLLHLEKFSWEEVYLLIDGGADLRIRCNCCSNTPLHLAAQNGHEAVARLLLEKGADVSALTGKHFPTPLHLAAYNGHEAVARLLLEKGADVSALEVDSSTPLHLAAHHGHEAVARLLLEKGADVSALENRSWTPLHLAAQNGHKAVARLLLERVQARSLRNPLA